MLGSSITKIARPRLSGVSLRDRLFHLLDEGRTKPVTWVGAPAGSGKTTLIASWLDARNLPCLWYQVDAGDGDLASFFYYMGRAAKKAAPRYKKPLPLLKPEYLQSVPLFTRRYFEELFQRLKPPATIVFDNYQDAPPESGFHEMFAHALETVPEGINVVVLSRTAPLSQLARLQANNLMQLIGWEDVRFTREESGEVLKLHGRGITDEETAALLHEKTEGWAAGLVLLMAGAGSSLSDARALDDRTPDSLFDYFASELFNRTDVATQDILLRTSFLQRIEPADAEKLTGNGMAGQILERLSRNHYFTQKYDRAYQYHPLFRNFLQTRARHTLSSSDIVRIQSDAALLLEKSGQPEEAIRLYIDACEWGGAQRLLLAQASMLVAQGRSNTLEGWLRHFPQELVGRSAWLLYWTGICRMAFDPQESRSWLEKAFELFKPQRDPAGAFLSWASIVDTFVYEWHDFKPLDHWIAEMEHLLADNPAFPTPEIEVRVAAGMLAMANRQPGRSDLPLWSERVMGAVMMSQDVQLKMTLGNSLIFYYLWAGDFSKLGVLMDALRPPAGHKGYDPLALQLWYVMEAMHAWFAADWKTCQRAISDGVKNADDSGIHLLDLYLLAQGVYGGLSLGDTAMAEACFGKMSLISSPRTGDKALHQYQASSIAWQRGDFKKSAEHGKLAAEICEEMGWTTAHVLCLMELAVTYFDDNRFEEADACLGRALDICRGCLIGLEFGVCMNGARFAFDRGKKRDGLVFLQQGLSLGARYGFLNIPRWNDANMSRLLATALEQDIETEYVRKLIKKRNLVPPPFRSTLAEEGERGMAEFINWPYPIRVYTLDKFEILVDDKPLVFTAKVQQKPLALLKALIALGGKDVAESRLTDILWPNAEGDLARKSFEMTVIRLRRLLGLDNALQLRDRCLSLDDRFCWVDVWALESLLAQVDAVCIKTGTSRSAPDEAARLIERAFELYRGDFLPGDDSSAWPLALRERLRSKFSRAIAGLGNSLEQAGHWENAAEVFRKGLEVDRRAEEFYQHLMVCYQRLGRRAEAVALYNRCRDILRESLGIAPSSRTEAVLRSIMAGD